ncbi:aspartate--tRNA ligase [Cyclobacteriaceae bacterium]|nr:aspartate--tRNA ligase [Cyclobacteriaceae bacterium]
MYRSHTCGELRLAHKNQQVTLAGWVQKSRDKGGMIWLDLRDRYGITQLIFEDGVTAEDVLKTVRSLGREFVIQVKGEVIERYAKNDKIPTGEIEIKVSELTILNEAELPPFIIEDETDGGDDLRMKYRYLDLRRNPVRNKLKLRHDIMREVRTYLDKEDFIEVETPVLIKSTPEGARDFLVPSRMNPGEFYALPQSPQTFKQLLMVGGFDKYFQIVKCFRDEDLRADRQPEFTQIDCEMSFVDQQDIIDTFEGLIKHLFQHVKQIALPQTFPHITFAEAIKKYGSDKPDLRFGMEFHELNDVAQNQGFQVFDSAELVVGINVPECANYSRKQLDAITKWMQRPQVGCKGVVYVKYNEDGSFKSSVDKFFNAEQLQAWADKMGAKPGDLMFVLAGPTNKTREQLSELRLEMGNRLGLRDPEVFKPVWVVDFPLLEWDEDIERFHAMHHPFTSPKAEDIALLDTDPGAVRANAYDLAINGVEVGGGSIRIHDKEVQALMFKHLGFTDEEAKAQFGFLMDAFEYGAPPHGGLAFGFDRLCAMFGGTDSIRDYIAFPKNNSGRDVMIDSPSPVDNDQLNDLNIQLKG